MSLLIHFKTVTLSFYAVITLGCFALLPQMRAVPDEGPSLPKSSSGSNTFDGLHALSHQTSSSFNTGIGWMSLTTQTTAAGVTGCGAGTLLFNTADFETAVGTAALLSNTVGNNNTAVGAAALLLNTTGADNTAVGLQALQANVSGVQNAALGAFAAQNTTNNFNTALGGYALQANTAGTRNTAVGAGAMEAGAAGNDNTAIGATAGDGLTGASNTVLGSGAGTGITSGGHNVCVGDRTGTNPSTASSNIYVGDQVNPPGPGLEFYTVRIGSNLPTGSGQSSCYIGGIAGQTVGAGGSACYVDNTGKLGVFLSARRYKENIRPMNDVSSELFSLKPVTFRYKPEFDKSGTPHFGLIAEEVAKVAPDLVIHDANGELSTVRYEAVNAMLLNEFLKEHGEVQELKKEILSLIAIVKEQGAQIQRVSTQIEMSKPSQQVVDIP